MRPLVGFPSCFYSNYADVRVDPRLRQSFSVLTPTLFPGFFTKLRAFPKIFHAVEPSDPNPPPWDVHSARFPFLFSSL